MAPGPSGWEVVGTIATLVLVIGTLVGVGLQNRLSRDALRVSRDALLANRDALDVSRRALEAEVFTRIAQGWDSVAMRERRRRLADFILKKPRSTPPGRVVVDVITFFEQVGTMLRAQQVSVEALWQFLGDEAIYYWEIVGEEFAKQEKKKWTSGEYWSEFRYLVDLMKEEDRRHDMEKVIVNEDKTSFLRAESDLA